MRYYDFLKKEKYFRLSKSLKKQGSDKALLLKGSQRANKEVYNFGQGVKPALLRCCLKGYVVNY